ncbi:MAG: hypothetical protein MUC65_10660, partial [Pontiellaceae bacterium]|nr:hypothetical protein [Pontiellaceae bacterium]
INFSLEKATSLKQGPFANLRMCIQAICSDCASENGDRRTDDGNQYAVNRKSGVNESQMLNYE